MPLRSRPCLLYCLKCLAYCLKGLAYCLKGLAYCLKGLAYSVKGLAYCLKGFTYSVKGLAYCLKGLARMTCAVSARVCMCAWRPCWHWRCGMWRVVDAELAAVAARLVCHVSNHVAAISLRLVPCLHSRAWQQGSSPPACLHLSE